MDTCACGKAIPIGKEGICDACFKYLTEATHCMLCNEEIDTNIGLCIHCLELAIAQNSTELDG